MTADPGGAGAGDFTEAMWEAAAWAYAATGSDELRVEDGYPAGFHYGAMMAVAFLAGCGLYEYDDEDELVPLGVERLEDLVAKAWRRRRRFLLARSQQGHEQLVIPGLEAETEEEEGVDDDEIAV